MRTGARGGRGGRPVEDKQRSGMRGGDLGSGEDGRPGEVGGVGERRSGVDVTAAAGRGDKGGDVVPWSLVLAVKPGVGCPASRWQGPIADWASALEGRNGGDVSLAKSGEIWEGLEGEEGNSANIGGGIREGWEEEGGEFKQGSSAEGGGVQVGGRGRRREFRLGG